MNKKEKGNNDIRVDLYRITQRMSILIKLQLADYFK